MTDTVSNHAVTNWLCVPSMSNTRRKSALEVIKSTKAGYPVKKGQSYKSYWQNMCWPNWLCIQLGALNMVAEYLPWLSFIQWPYSYRISICSSRHVVPSEARIHPFCVPNYIVTFYLKFMYFDVVRFVL